MGSGHLKYLFWDLYRVTFWVSQSADFETDPLANELPNQASNQWMHPASWPASSSAALAFSYSRSVSKERLVSSTIDEIQKQANHQQPTAINELQLSHWREALSGIWPSVESGSRLTAVFSPKAGTFFFDDERLLGNIQGPGVHPANNIEYQESVIRRLFCSAFSDTDRHAAHALF